MRLLRLSGRKVCERVKTKGFLWKGKHLHVRWMQGAPRTILLDAPLALYVGTLTSAKLDKSAVRRNRMRRRCREALRITLKDSSKTKVSFGASYQLLLFPRSSSLSADFRDILADISHFLTSLSCPQQSRNRR